MDPATWHRLRELNRAFYLEHALDFAASRPRLAPGVRRMLDEVPPGARVLEVGCGDGQVARALSTEGRARSYLGLDLSPAMLQRAASLTRAAAHPAALAFAPADLSAPGWEQALEGQAFDVVLAFAVFHHLPGWETRRQALRALAAHLAPAGWLVFSNWQFTRSARLRAHRIPWETLGLAQALVEPGDSLLSWERGGRRGLRYVHLLDPAEAHALAAEAGLVVTRVFASDGRQGDLADYVQMRKSG